MNRDQIQAEIAEKCFERGLEQGFERGFKRGYEKGQTEALRRIALALATAKLGDRFDSTLEERTRVAGLAALDALVALMIASNDPAEILAMFARLS